VRQAVCRIRFAAVAVTVGAVLIVVGPSAAGGTDAAVPAAPASPITADPHDVATLVRAGLLRQARVEAEAQSGDKARAVAPSGPTAVHALGWAPDGRQLLLGYAGPAVGDEQGFALIDADHWRETMRLAENGRASIDGVAISPDGTLATGSFNGGARLWDSSGRPRAGVDCGRGAGEGGARAPNGAAAVAFARDGQRQRLVVACVDGSLRIWDVSGDRAQPVRTLALHVPISVLALSPDGGSIAWGGWDGQLGVSAVDGKRSPRELAKRLLPKRGPAVNSVGFGAGGAILMASDAFGNVRTWDAASGHLRRHIKVKAGVTVPAAISPDGRVVATGGPEGLIFWDEARGTALDRHPDAAGDLPSLALAFRPDGALLAVGGPQGLHVWDVSHRARIADLPALGQTGTEAVTFAPQGETLATSTVDGLRLWAFPAGGQSALPVAAATGLGIGARIVFAARGDPAQPAQTQPAQAKPDQTKGDVARLWPAPSGAGAYAVDSTGALTALAQADGDVAIDDAAGKRVRLLRERIAPRPKFATAPATETITLAFSPDGATLAVASGDARIVLWNLATGDKVSELRRTHGSAALSALAVSSHGGSIAVGTTQGSVELWDVAGARLSRTVAVAPGYPRAIAFSPDGARLAVGSSQRGTLVFASPFDHPFVRLVALPNRDATFVEALPAGPTTAAGADAVRFVACRAGRFVLPSAACDAAK
jgi:WD40 repeat protein